MSKLRRFRWNGRPYRLMEVKAGFLQVGVIGNIVLVMHAGGRKDALALARYALERVNTKPEESKPCQQPSQ